MDKFEELVAKLEELFELDKADLDFGLHRIIRAGARASVFLTKAIFTLTSSYG